MRYRILKSTRKNDNWRVLDVQECIENGESFQDVSVNKIDKKTGLEAFLNFDKFEEGYEFEANPWTNDKGTMYLFAPKPKTNAPQGNSARSGAIAKAQETKREDIAAAQDNKHKAIALAGAMRDATQIALASLKDAPFPTDVEFKAEWEKWCKWLLAKGSEPFI